MTKKEYLTPNIEVKTLYCEDIITTSDTFVVEDDDGRSTVGGFGSNWID